MLLPILIVEDEAVVAAFAETVLKSKGFAVTVAHSVPEAQKALAGFPAGEKLCLVVDVVLDEDSGIAFAQQLVDTHPEYRVLLMSGFTDEVLLTLPDHAQRIAFLRKPFSSSELVNAVNAVCGQK